MQLQLLATSVETKEVSLKDKVFLGNPLSTENAYVDLPLTKGSYTCFTVRGYTNKWKEGQIRSYISGFIPSSLYDEEYFVHDLQDFLKNPESANINVNAEFGFWGIFTKKAHYDWLEGPLDRVITCGYTTSPNTNVYFETAGVKTSELPLYNFKKGFVALIKPGFEQPQIDFSPEFKFLEMQERVLGYPEYDTVTDFMTSFLNIHKLSIEVNVLDETSVISLLTQTGDVVSINLHKNANVPLQFIKEGRSSKKAALYELYKTLYYTNRLAPTSINANDVAIPVSLPQLEISEPTPFKEVSKSKPSISLSKLLKK